jgi:uncharacterized small protein (DUF1192 family)
MILPGAVPQFSKDELSDRLAVLQARIDRNSASLLEVERRAPPN